MRKKTPQPELALWRAVLVQALVDAYKPSRAKWEGMDRRADREDAKKWLEGGAELGWVCALADVDVDYIKDAVIPRRRSRGNR